MLNTVKSYFSWRLGLSSLLDHHGGGGGDDDDALAFSI